MTVDALGIEVRHDGALGETRPSDVVVSADGSQIYAAGSDGNLRIYDAETGQLLQTIAVGSQLGGIALSPDGSFIMAVERVPLEEHYAEPWWENEFTVTAYRIDLESGEVTSFPTVVTGFDYTFFDVAVLANGDVLFTQSILPGWSGWVSMKLLDLDTGTYTEASGTIRHDSTIAVSDDGSYALITQYDTSDAPLLVYQSGVGVVAEHGLYEDGVSGFNNGVQAISVEANLIAQGMPSTIHIYDAALDYQFSLSALHPGLVTYELCGLAFDASGEFLFILDGGTDTITQVSTADWSIVGSFAVGADLQSSDGDYGNRLIIGPDMRYFLVVTGNGLLQVDNPSVSSTMNGTNAADAITGTGLFDEILGNGGNDNLSALGGNDIVAGGAGNDMIDGGAGNDILDGGAGDDNIEGGDGIDTADYRSATAGVTVNLSVNTAQNTGGAGSDTLSGIENIEGSNFNDNLTGDANANRLSGGAGDDTLSGGAGDDFLIGGEGNDKLSGGLGYDIASYAGAAAAVTVSLATIAAQNTGGAGVDTLSSISGLIGSNFNDVLTGNQYSNLLSGGGGDDRLIGGDGSDTLDGGAGLDKMFGGLGDDIYYVDSSSDAVVEYAGEGTDLVHASVNYTLKANVENVELEGSANLYATGNELANRMQGNSGANKLYGLDGDDRLEGHDGNDLLDGGTGVDLMTGGTGDDIYYVDNALDKIIENAGEGIDTVRASLSYTLRDNIERLELQGSDDLTGYGNSLDNILTGNAGANILYGRDGNDKLYGEDGADVLKGENGNDWIEGGAGRDRFYGGLGSDDFVFRDGDFAGLTSSTCDQIHDFSQLEGDRIRLNLVDANSGLDGDQAFSFIGTGVFSGTAGELRTYQANGQTYVQGDVDGDGVGDFLIRLDGLHTLQAGDFIM